MQTTRKHQGFTLIELLVVIAIIALLVSILLPSLRKAKHIAKLMMCQTHLRNIGMSAQFYSQDYDSVFPPYCADIWWAASVVSGKTGSKLVLDDMWKTMTPYGLQGETSQCPVTGNADKWENMWMKSWNSRSNYFYQMVTGSYWNPASYDYLAAENIKNATSHLLICDTADNPNSTGMTWANQHQKQDGTVESQSKYFMDGHVILDYSPHIAKRVGLGW